MRGLVVTSMGWQLGGFCTNMESALGLGRVVTVPKPIYSFYKSGSRRVFYNKAISFCLRKKKKNVKLGKNKLY